MDKKIQSFFQTYADADEALDVRMGSDVIGDKVPAISTGSPGLDDALSSGGIPTGRLVQYYGAAGSGKTFCAMLAIKEAQKKDPKAKQLVLDAEGSFSVSWCEVIGIDVSRLIIVDGDMAVNGRKLFEMILGINKEDKNHNLSGKSKNGLLDEIRNGNININMIVLDSLGSLVPPIEDVSAVGKQNMTTMARFLPPVLRRLSLEVKKANVAMLIINHKKASLNMYGPDHGFSGGNVFTHFLSCNVYFEAIQRKEATIFNEKEQKIGHMVRATIEKSKFGVWPRKCEFKLDFSKGVIDRHEEIITLALDYDVIKKPTSMSYEYGDMKWVGAAKLNEALANDAALCADVEEKISIARDTKFDKIRAEQKAKGIAAEEEKEVVETDEEVEVKRGRKSKVVEL